MEGVSVLFGANYGDKSPNLGVVLKGFDGGFQNSLRIGRQGYSGRLFGAVAVLAQESTVKAILNAGRQGGGSRGVCERFLIIQEPNIIHKRDPRQSIQVPFDTTKNYRALVENILNSNGVRLTLSTESHEFLMDLLVGFRDRMADGGQFSGELMRSVIGKADAQLCKIASVLHIAKEWSPSGSQKTVIHRSEFEHAAAMYVQLIRSFYSAAESEGIDGELPMLRAAAKKLTAIIGSDKKPRANIRYTDFSDSLRNTKPFSDIKGLRKTVLEKLIPALVDAGFIIFDSNEGLIHINPRLKYSGVEN
jgi:hypothetical protein